MLKHWIDTSYNSIKGKINNLQVELRIQKNSPYEIPLSQPNTKVEVFFFVMRNLSTLNLIRPSSELKATGSILFVHETRQRIQHIVTIEYVYRSYS